MKSLSQTQWWIINLVMVTLMVAMAMFASDEAHVPPELPERSTPEIPLLTSASMPAVVKLTSYQLPSPPTHSVKSVTLVERNTFAGTNAASTQPVLTTTEPLQVNQNTMVATPDLHNVGLTIDLPTGTSQRERIGRFLYQCVGIGFGIIHANKQPVQVELIRGQRGNASQFLRKLAHSPFDNERHWQAALSAHSEFVRIYPMWVDEVLLMLISKQLTSSSLKQFSATYHLSGNRLQLIDIQINNQPLEAVWTLVDGQQKGCANVA